MRLHYCKSAGNNFGDAMNGWFWDRVVPEISASGEGPLLVGIGTILDADVPPGRPRIVLGAGAGYSRLPRDITSDSWRIYGVRGPLTASVLGLPDACALTDPAILVSTFPECHGPKTDSTLFIPHWKSLIYGRWPEICGALGLEFLDPRSESRDVIRKISSAKKVITESMHGAIIADAFRVPWIPVTLSREFSAFKWTDWTLSKGFTTHVYCLSPSSVGEALRNRLLSFTEVAKVSGYPQESELSSPRKLTFGQKSQLIEEFLSQIDKAPSAISDFRNFVLEASFKRIAPRLKGVGRSHFDRAALGLKSLNALPGLLSPDDGHETALGRMVKRSTLCVATFPRAH